MVTTSNSDGEQKLDNRSTHSEKVERRLQQTLERLKHLPDDALIDARAVSALRGRSLASTWRDAANGQLGPLVRLGERSTRFRLGHVRRSMKENAA